MANRTRDLKIALADRALAIRLRVDVCVDVRPGTPRAPGADAGTAARLGARVVAGVAGVAALDAGEGALAALLAGAACLERAADG